MKRVGLSAAVLAVYLLAAPVCAQETLEYPRFGKLTIYRPASGNIVNVVLFISGDGGWNMGVIWMARSLAQLDSLVVGININSYRKSLAKQKKGCVYAAADFEALSQFVQQKLGLPRYSAPILVGYSSGASLAYALLAQAPSGTFLGAISLGFCPELEWYPPFCRGQGLQVHRDKKTGVQVIEPSASLGVPWVALQGTIDQDCLPENTRSFVEKVKDARIVMLPKVGHGFSVERRWMPQFKQAFKSMGGEPALASAAQELPGSVQDLPLVEMPARGKKGTRIAVILSGDGGWAGIDREIGGVLVSQGVPVVGWNSLKYFWNRKNPEKTAVDLARVMRHYLKAWDAKTVVLIGYSLGADVAPFMASRLPSDLRDRVELLALVGPAPTVDFEFHFSEWVTDKNRQSYQVLPEINKLKGKRMIFIYGKDDGESIGPEIPEGLGEKIALEGSHHFNGAYREIALRILRAADRP